MQTEVGRTFVNHSNAGGFAWFVEARAAKRVAAEPVSKQGWRTTGATALPAGICGTQLSALFVWCRPGLTRCTFHGERTCRAP